MVSYIIVCAGMEMLAEDRKPLLSCTKNFGCITPLEFHAFPIISGTASEYGSAVEDALDACTVVVLVLPVLVSDGDRDAAVPKLHPTPTPVTNMATTTITKKRPVSLGPPPFVGVQSLHLRLL